MRINYRKSRNLVLSVASATACILSACGSGQADATPTMSVSAIYTAAYFTFEAKQATQLALTPPSTPTLLPSPTLLPPATLASLPFGTATTSIGGGAALCDNSAFIKDVTIPDGTILDPSKNFVKTWALMNNGTCAWTTRYKLALVGGDAMGGASVPVPTDVPVGQQVNISVSLIAPADAGSYTGSWQLQNASGQSFGNIITVVIKVAAATSSTDTPGTPRPTKTPKPTP